MMRKPANKESKNHAHPQTRIAMVSLSQVSQLAGCKLCKETQLPNLCNKKDW